MWLPAHSGARRTSRTVTGRWLRTAVRSAKLATGMDARGRPPAHPRGVPAAPPASLSMPIRSRSGCAATTCPGGIAEQGQRDSLGDEPAQLAGEVAAILEAHRSADVPGGECAAAARVHDPFAGGDASGQGGGVSAGPRRQVGGDRAAAGGPAALAAHVREIGR